MKILYISSFGGCGGSEIALSDLLPIIPGNKKIFIFHGGDFEQLLIRNKYDIYIAANGPITITQKSSLIDIFTNTLKIINIYYKLLIRIYLYKPDLVITNDTKSLAMYCLLIFKPKHHIHYLHAIIDDKFAGALNYFTRYIFRNVDNYLCNSKYTALCLSEFITVKANITIAYQYFLTPKFYPLNNEVKRFSGIIVLGVVSRVSRLKNIDIVISTMARLKFSGKEFILNIYGEAFTKEDLAYKTELVNLIKEFGLEDSVRFMNHVSDPNLIYKNISLLITASELESFGRVIVEAMSYRIPVVASYIPAHLELIKDNENGILFDNAEGALFSKIIDICNDKNKAYEIINNAYSSAMKRYSKNKFTSVINNFVMNIMH